MVVQIQDGQVGREGLAGVPCGARALTPTALGARVEVEQLLARKVGDGLRTQRLFPGLEFPEVDLERFERTGWSGAGEPHVERARDDVEMLGVRQIDQEPEHEQDVRPEERPGEERPPATVHPSDQELERYG